jgi:hypothetical protein
MDILLIIMVLLAIGLAVFPTKSRSKRQHLREIDSAKAGDLLRPSKREKITA